MIKKLNSTLSKVNDIVGIDMDIPKPSKVLISLGTLGAISTVATTHEIKKY